VSSDPMASPLHPASTRLVAMTPTPPYPIDGLGGQGLVPVAHLGHVHELMDGIHSSTGASLRQLTPLPHGCWARIWPSRDAGDLIWRY
jgi:hypothetical protein